jgi:heme/copper-type cytochrome/quinol oxidase subunit 4
MWFGLLLMVVLVVGLIWWLVWAMKKDKEKSK